MSVEQVESAIRALSPEQLRQLAHWFDDHRHELVPASETLESAQQREVLTRLTETDAGTSLLAPFEEKDVDGLFQEFAHARAQKASARQS